MHRFPTILLLSVCVPLHFLQFCKMIILKFLSYKLQISISLESVAEILAVFFGGVIVTWIFMIHAALHWCLKYLHTGFSRYRQYPAFSFLTSCALPLKSQLCWVGARFKAVAGSAVASIVGGLVSMGLGGCGSDLIPWWIDCFQYLIQ